MTNKDKTGSERQERLRKFRKEWLKDRGFNSAEGLVGALTRGEYILIQSRGGGHLIGNHVEGFYINAGDTRKLRKGDVIEIEFANGKHFREGTISYSPKTKWTVVVNGIRYQLEDGWGARWPRSEK